MAWKITNNHDEIRTWMNRRGGLPAVLRGEDEMFSSLAVIFPGTPPRGDFEGISWDEFFDFFETNNLSFRYDENAESMLPEYVDSSYGFIGRNEAFGMDNDDFPFPETSDTAEENIFGSAPPIEEHGTPERE